MNADPRDADVRVAPPASRQLPPRQNTDAGPQETTQQEVPPGERLEIDPSELPALAQLLIQQKEEAAQAHIKHITAMELRMTAMHARIIRYEGMLRQSDTTIKDLQGALNSAQMMLDAAQNPTDPKAGPEHDGGEYGADEMEGRPVSDAA